MGISEKKQIDENVEKIIGAFEAVVDQLLKLNNLINYFNIELEHMRKKAMDDLRRDIPSS